MGADNHRFVEQLKNDGSIRSKNIFNAFLAIDRKDFVPDDCKSDAYLNMPIPLGYESTTSQPGTIAFMLEKLEFRRGQRVLEIGTGSGFLTALLARLAGPKGKVYSVEYIPELKAFAEANLAKYGFRNIELFTGDGKAGLNDKAPFDRIICSAEAHEIPEAWKTQLEIKGVLITPFHSDILKLIKKTPTQFTEKKFPAFAFVELK